jgi:polygalacturonase
MLFYNVKGFKLSELTIKDPSQYGVTMDKVSYFTVEDITFDYNLGNPYPINMDGIHLDGNCHYGVIRNLKGTCYDDLVAINAHEGSRGPITNIQIDGLFAENCHSAVRLLSLKQTVQNIHISNVFGTYYQYCIGITKGYKGETEGYFDAITLENLCVSKAMPVRKGDFQHPPKIEQVCPLIFIQGNTNTSSLTLKTLHRRENTLPKETVFVGEGARIDRFLIEDVTVENHTGEPMPFLVNHGKIGYLLMQSVDTGVDTRIVSDGEIQKMQAEEN